MIADMTVLENVAQAHTCAAAGRGVSHVAADRKEEQSLFRKQKSAAPRRHGRLMHELAGNLAWARSVCLKCARAVQRPCLCCSTSRRGLRHKRKGLADVLRQLRGEGLSILLVEHDMDLVMQVTDRIVVMEFGTRLIEARLRNSASPGACRYLGTEH